MGLFRHAMVLRRRLPRSLKTAGRLAAELVDPVRVGLYRLLSTDRLPVPPSHLRARVGSRGIGRFIRIGGRWAVRLQQGVSGRTGRAMTDFAPVLDFGCGAGRTLRHLAPGTRSVFHGCDVDAEAVAWLAANFPEVAAVPNGDPPLPYPDGTFGLVYAISVFTHLDEELQFRWLAELRRILRQGGLALFSVQGENALRLFTSGRMLVSPNLADRLVRRSPLDPSGFIHEPYDDLANRSEAYPGIEGVYGLAFHGEGYLREKWSRFFDVLGVDRTGLDSLQDLVILRKR